MMRFLSAFLIFTLASVAHATFTASTVYSVPKRQDQKTFRLVDDATAVLDVGLAEPSRLFRWSDPGNFLLLTGFDPNGITMYEPAPHQLFFLGEQEENSFYNVRRYIKGYDLSAGQATQLVSYVIYRGANTNAPAPTTALSSDGSKIYFIETQNGKSSVLAMDLKTLEVTSLFALSNGDPRSLYSLQEVQLLGQTSLALTTLDNSKIPSIALYEMSTGKVLSQVRGSSLGLSRGTTSTLSPATISSDGTRSLLCDATTCVLFDMTTGHPVDKWRVLAVNGAAAEFSPDGRFVLISQPNAQSNGTDFTIYRAEDGAVASASTPALGSVGKIVALPEQRAYLVAHGPTLFLLSADDGSVAQRYTQVDATNFFSDISLLDAADDMVRFMSVDSKGLVQSWELSL